MHPQLQSVIQLQGLDGKIAVLEREVASLPRHIAEIEKALESHKRRLEADRAALAANQKDRKKLESDIQDQEQKISKLKDQMLQVKTNEQYRAFQHEIDWCSQEIRKCEDRILDLMAASEPLDQNVRNAEIALKQEIAQVEGEKQQARERTAADQAELEVLRGERTVVAGTISAALNSLYERVRKKWHGIVVADASDGRCSACNLALRPQFLQDLRRSVEVMCCENCGRILSFNPPVSFDDQFDAPAHAEASRPAGV